MDQTVLSYFKSVLGIEYVSIPATLLANSIVETVTHPVHENEIPRLLVVDSCTEYTENQKTLLGKMITAVGLDVEHYDFFCFPNSDEIPAFLGQKNYLHALVFDKALAERLSHFFQEVEIDLTTTHGPPALEKNPALKKQAWEDLKKMRENPHFKKLLPRPTSDLHC